MNIRFLCPHRVKVLDKVLNRFIYVPCGKCSVCRTKRSAYFSKMVSAQISLSKFNYFFTLSYTDDYLPLCKLQHNEEDNCYEIRTICDRFVTPLGETDVCLKRLPVTLESIDYYDILLSRRSPYAHYPTDCVPILNYYDVKLFFKRFRKKLISLNLSPSQTKFKYFVCGEYGGFYKRPHYHLLLSTDSEHVIKCFESTITTSPFAISKDDVFSTLWKFGSINYKLIEDDGKGTDSYISGYVSGNDFCGDFYENPLIRTKCRHSQNYGKEVLHYFKADLQNFANMSPDSFCEVTTVYKGKEFVPSESYEIISELYKPVPFRDTSSDDVLCLILQYVKYNSKEKFSSAIASISWKFYLRCMQQFYYKELPCASLRETYINRFFDNLYYRYCSVVKCIDTYHHGNVNLFVRKYDRLMSLINYRMLTKSLGTFSALHSMYGVYPWSLYYTSDVNDFYVNQSVEICSRSQKIAKDRKQHNDKVIRF